MMKLQFVGNKLLISLSYRQNYFILNYFDLFYQTSQMLSKSADKLTSPPSAPSLTCFWPSLNFASMEQAYQSVFFTFLFIDTPIIIKEIVNPIHNPLSPIPS